MWTYRNPVDVRFGRGSFDGLPALIGGRPYALVTYDEDMFHRLACRLAGPSGPPVLTVCDIAPNPDISQLSVQIARFAQSRPAPQVLVALGGGSVIDSAKVFAAAQGRPLRLDRLLKTADGRARSLPVIAVPTTAGTGSEVTCWATVWSRRTQRKHSLSLPSLYPSHAVVDPDLMASMPRGLTIATALDALSHAFESIWNRNANPISSAHAVAAARDIIGLLPRLVEALDDIELRARISRAALQAGLAFSNTRTAVAHSISYALTLRNDIQHGIACSFTLPLIVRSLARQNGPCRDGLTAILGEDLSRGAARLDDFLAGLGVATDPASHGVAREEWPLLVRQALEGERGQNFIGSAEALLSAGRP